MTKAEFVENCSVEFGLSSKRINDIFKNLNIKPFGTVFNPKCNKRTIAYKQEDFDKVLEVCKQLKKENDDFLSKYKELRNADRVYGKYKPYMIQRNHKIYCLKEMYDEIKSYLDLPYNEKCKLNINAKMNIEKYDDEFTINCRHFIDSFLNYKFNSEDIINTLNNINMEFRILENIHHRGVFIFIRECDSERLKNYMLLNPKEKGRKTMTKRYGVDNPLAVSQFMDKYKQTCLDRYGDENVNNTEEIKNKIKETNMNRYGVEYIPQTDWFVEKTKETNLVKYGEEWYTRTDEYKEKARQTNLEKYGAENYSQTSEFKEKCKEIWKNRTDEELKEINDKKKKTKFEHYGDENYSNVEKAQQTKLERYGDKGYHNYEQMKKTVFDKYGVEHLMQSDEFKKKSKETLIERYGFDNPLAVPQFKEKFKQTSLERYGVPYPSQNPSIIEKTMRVRLEKYGCINGMKFYEYNNVKFDSSSEIYFYIYHHDILKDDITRGKYFEYYTDNKKRIYECDFLVNGENIEIKGEHLINENMELIDFFGDGHILKEKTQCMRDNNVRIILSESNEMKEIIKIVEEKFPHLVESCRIKKNKVEDENYEDEYDDYDTTNTIFEM